MKNDQAITTREFKNLEALEVACGLPKRTHFTRPEFDACLGKLLPDGRQVIRISYGAPFVVSVR